jgi:hypothetical protein
MILDSITCRKETSVLNLFFFHSRGDEKEEKMNSNGGRHQVGREGRKYERRMRRAMTEEHG